MKETNMNDDYTLRKAFWHLKKFSSYTWGAEIHRLFTQFVNDFEAWMRTGQPESSEFEEDVLRSVWYMQGKAEEGLDLLKNSHDKSRAYSLIREGFGFGYMFWADRWFTDMDTSMLEKLGFVNFHYKFKKSCFGLFKSLGAAETMRLNFFSGLGGTRTCDRVLYPRKYLPFTHEYRTPLWEPSVFPPLPTPARSIEILSEEEVPVTGIWMPEPIADDPIPAEMLQATSGRQTYCMNFMTQGVIAPKMTSEEEYLLVTEQRFRPIPSDRTVRWRLLWKDERYGPNGIPDEEKDYLRVEEESSAPPMPPKQDPGIQRCEGGKPCPVAGYWDVWHQPGSRRYFQKGEIMPSGVTGQGECIWYWGENQGA